MRLKMLPPLLTALVVAGPPWTDAARAKPAGRRLAERLLVKVRDKQTS